MTTRRGFITTLLAASAMPALSWADAGGPAFLAAAQDADGAFALYGVTAAGADGFRVALPARAHAGAAHPARPEAVVFARRPGAFALVLNCATGALLAQLSPPAGHHFNGHGTFDAAGEVLYTVENVTATSEGRIGLWSRAGWRRIGQIESGGLGPHDLLRLPRTDVLAVANGGLITDPADERHVLNVATMRPNLSYLTVDGVHEVLELPDQRAASIRHLAVRADGLVAFAMQWSGDPDVTVPLLGLHRIGEPPRLLAAPEVEQMAMQGYAGSVAFGPGGGTVAITSPRGGRVHVFDVAGRFAASLPRADVCGLGLAAGMMVATDGLGGVLRVVDGALRPIASAGRAWDNHIVAV